MCLPPDKLQQWKSCTSSTVLSLKILLYSSCKSNSWGEFSLIIWRQSKKMGTVVSMTRNENKKVQIGSAIAHSGLILMMMAAEMTPMDWTISPRMWMTAALMFKFSCSFTFFEDCCLSSDAAVFSFNTFRGVYSSSTPNSFIAFMFLSLKSNELFFCSSPTSI